MANIKLGVFILIAAILAVHTSATDTANLQTFNVGDAKGWAPGADFKGWAARDFLIGDKLVATLALHSSADSTPSQTIEVGDSKGWAPGVDYKAWTARDFLVGDKLVFKYDAGKYNVMEVDANSFSECIVATDKKALTSGADTISLDKPGTKYFICGTENGKYCKSDNMKVQIDVPGPVKSGEPTGPKEYIVGDDKGWAVGVDYEAWMQGKEIMIGDTLVFKYPVGTQNVYTVHEDLYKDCVLPTPDLPKATGEDRIVMPGQGVLGFISSVDNNCQKGVKLLVKIGCPLKKKIQGGRKLVPN